MKRETSKKPKEEIFIPSGKSPSISWKQQASRDIRQKEKPARE
jgi:hypothetical protein